MFSLRIGEPTTRSVQGAVSVLAERARVPKNIAMCVCSRQGSNRIAASCSLACTLMMASDRSSETERGVDRTTRRAGQSGRVAETGRVFYLRTESSAKTKEKPPMPPCVQQRYMSCHQLNILNWRKRICIVWPSCMAYMLGLHLVRVIST